MPGIAGSSPPTRRAATAISMGHYHRDLVLVLTVRDIAKSCAFYQRVLGMEVKQFAGGRIALHFGDQKINLHEAGAEFEPKAARPTPGSADLCLVIDGPLAKAIATVQSEKIELIEGPVERTGAVGSMRSIYFRDPDGNLIEVSEYP